MAVIGLFLRGKCLLNNALKNKSILCIDVGNTNITFGLYENDVQLCSWRLETTKNLTINMIVDSIKANDSFNCRGVIIGSVVPKITTLLQELGTVLSHANVLFCDDSSVDWGFKILSGDSREVGTDILLNGVAGFEKYKKAMLIIDFGTATTFDVFDDNGDFLGTVIAPGVNLSLRALYQAAAQLPEVSVAPTDKVVGTNTRDCMQSGIFWGYISMVEGLVSRIQNELEVDLQVIATGGLAPLFEEKTSVINTLEQSLTLDGLYILAKRNALLNE